MIIKKVTQLVSAILISVYSLLSVGIPLAHAANLTCTWTGNSLFVGHLMSDSTNWVNCGGQAPGAIGGDTYNLIFPAASEITPVDDIASLSVGTITINSNLSSYSSGYDITESSGQSNVINVGNGITDNSTGQVNKIEVSLSFSGSPSITSNANSQLQLGDGTDPFAIGSSAVTMSTNTVVSTPITGSGSLTVNDSLYPAQSSGVDLKAASPGFSGSVTVTAGALFVDDANSLSAASSVTVASGAYLKGNGGISNGTIQSGGFVAPGHSPGCISASNMTIPGNYTAQIGGTTACSEYDQLQVSSLSLIHIFFRLSLSISKTLNCFFSFNLKSFSGSTASSSLISETCTRASTLGES